MALNKDLAAITQVTATGQSITLDISASYRTTAYIRHVNGTGTISAGASIQIQVRPEGSSTWVNFGGALVANTTASATQYWSIQLPDDAGEVRIDYTAPSGSTGHTLDMEVGKIISI